MGARRGCPPGKALLAACLLVLVAGFAARPASAQDDAPLARLFDTGAPLAGPLTPETLARQDQCRLVPEDTVNHLFAGDALLLNDKLAVLLGKQGRGIELYSRMAGGLKRRATLRHAATLLSPLDSLAGLKIVQNTSSGVTVEARFGGAEPAAARLRLTTGEAILEIQSQAGPGFLDVQSDTRYVVVPEYFGDDAVYGSEVQQGLYLPAENFCLNLLAGGEAMLMSVWGSSQQEAWLGAPSRSNAGRLGSTRLRCLTGKSLWLALLESPGLWHDRLGLGDDSWKPPFPAKWRASLLRTNGFADSWDLDLGPGAEQKPGPLPAPLIVCRIVYPLDRSTATPLTASCLTDVMRNTLGVGPCQYILACEGLAAQGDPTPNSVMGWVEKQFEQRKDKKAGDEIKDRLQFMVKHVADARNRIERYAQFATRLRQALAGKPGPFFAIADDLDHAAAAGLAPAAAPERARQLAREVAALIGQPNPLPACQRLAKDLRAIGAVQDRALAKCRMDVRRARQQARTLAANPSAEPGPAPQVLGLAEATLEKK
jgi:hypothetical protein